MSRRVVDLEVQNTALRETSRDHAEQVQVLTERLLVTASKEAEYAATVRGWALGVGRWALGTWRLG